jgi:hypothetical protein
MAEVENNNPPADVPGVPDAPDSPVPAKQNGGGDDKPKALPEPAHLTPAQAPMHLIPTGGGGIFPAADAETIKEKVRAAKKKPDPYDVKQCYKDANTSFFSKVASAPLFENITLTVIIINAMWIAVDTDRNACDVGLRCADPWFVIADVLFFGYFSVELFIRFAAFEKKVNCCKDPWFVFDSSLVFLYALDPFILTVVDYVSDGGGLPFPTAILRLFRLARLSRLVRALRSFPELVIMIKGMTTAVSSVSYVLLFLVMTSYIFGIALVQLGAETSLDNEPMEDGPDPVDYFPKVGQAMWMLWVYGIFGDNLAEFCDTVRERSTVCLAIVTVFIIVGQVMILNMLIGILCQVISGVAEEERESIMVDKVHEKFGEIVKSLDRNKSGTISWSEFQVILQNQRALSALESVSVDAEGLIDAAEDYFFEDGKETELTFEGFMDMVLELRGGQQAMVKDLIGLGKRFSRKMLQVKDIMDELDAKIDKLMEGA